MEGEHTRVVHRLAAAGQQLRRGSARALGGTDEGHSPRGAATELRRAGLGWRNRSRAGHASRRLMDARALVAPQRQQGLAPRTRQVLGDYVELTKPKVQSLLLLTTIATMYVAGDPSLLLVVLTCLGG